MLLHSAIDAYSNLILTREKLDINGKNLNLLNRQVENDKIRLDRGQITITDLSAVRVFTCRCSSSVH